MERRAETQLYRVCQDQTARLREFQAGNDRVEFSWRHLPVKSHLYEKQHKRCTWCGEAIEDKSRRKNWHPDCSTVYLCATQQIDPRVHLSAFKGRETITCQSCGVALQTGWKQEMKSALWRNIPCEAEWDHYLAIGVANRLGIAAALYRAHHPANLRPLCHLCHVVKTTLDRKIMRIFDGTYKPPRLPEQQLFPDSPKC